MNANQACSRLPGDTSRTLVLVVPPQHGLIEGTSAGLIAIANYVSNHAPTIVVRLVDFARLGFREMAAAVSQEVLAAQGRLFIGITGTTASYQGMLATARAFKQAEPSCVVVFGGHHATPQDEVILNNHADIVDFVIRGEGEIALTALVHDYPRIDAVPNLSLRAEGTIRRTLDAPLLTREELDRIGPTFGGAQTDASQFGRAAYVSARGCPLACSFCVVRSSPMRANSIAAFTRDLRHLAGERGYQRLSIEDNFFAHQPRRTRDICAAITELRREYPLQWDCQTRVESMCNREIVEMMARAGCDAVYLGVESLVPKYLLYLGKTIHPERYLEMLRDTAVPLILNAGIAAYVNLQTGLPGETAMDRDQAVSALSELGKAACARHAVITVFPQLHVVYPGTPHFDMAIEKGYFGPLGRDVFEEFTAWESMEEPILQYLGEHFAHGVGGIPLGILDRGQLVQGRFAVCPRGLSAVSTQLRRMEEIPGIQIFHYGRHLTREASVHA